MFSDVFGKITEALADHRNRKSSWGRWAGSLILAIILITWSVAVIKTGNWIPLDGSTCLFMGAIFAFNAIKSVFETTKIATPSEETVETSQSSGNFVEIRPISSNSK